MRAFRIGGFSRDSCVVTFDSYTDKRDAGPLGVRAEVLPDAGDRHGPRDLAGTTTGTSIRSCGAALEAVRDAVRGYRRVVAYGSSMGAYAALRFGGWAGADCAVALSPQYSIRDPAVMRFEKRWADASARFRRCGRAGAVRHPGGGVRGVRPGRPGPEAHRPAGAGLLVHADAAAGGGASGDGVPDGSRPVAAADRGGVPGNGGCGGGGGGGDAAAAGVGAVPDRAGEPDAAAAAADRLAGGGGGGRSVECGDVQPSWTALGEMGRFEEAGRGTGKGCGWSRGSRTC